MNSSAVGNYDNFTNATQASIYHGTANNTSGNMATNILKTRLRSAQMAPHAISNRTFHRFDEKPFLRDQVSKVEQSINRNTGKVITRREAIQIVAKVPQKTTLKSNDDADAINKKSGKSHAPRLPFLARQSVSQQISADDFISRSATKNTTVADNTLQDGFAVKEQIKSRTKRSTTEEIWGNFAPDLHSGKRVDILVEKLDKCVEENDQVGENKKLAKCIAKETASTIIQTCRSKIAELLSCTLGAMRQQNIVYEEALITVIGEVGVNAEKKGIYPQVDGQNWEDVLDWVDAEYAKSDAAEATNEAQLAFVSKEIKSDKVGLDKRDSVKDIIKAIPRKLWHTIYEMDEMERGEALLKILEDRYVDQPLTLNQVTYDDAKKILSQNKLNRPSKRKSYECLKKTVTAFLEGLHAVKVV